MTLGRAILSHMRRLLAPALLVFALTACGGDPDVVEQDTSSKGDSDTKEQPAEEQGTLIDSGFGQSGEYVGLAALVKNKSDRAGQTVTVSFNLLDEKGELIKTESQVDAFAWPGQERAIVTQADVEPGVKVAKVEATLLIEDDELFADTTSEDLGTADAPLADDEYGGKVAKVQLTNPTSKVLKDPGIQVVCFNASEEIVGSGFTFAELIAANGKFAEDVDVLVSDEAETCKAYLVPSLI